MRNSQKFLLSLITVGIVGGMGANGVVSATHSGVGQTVDMTHQVLLNGKDYKKSTAEWLADLFGRRRGRGGSHGELCAIAPNPTNGNFRTSWNTQPLFAWGGDVITLEVLDVTAGNESIWSHSLTDSEKQQQYALYGGTPLERQGRYMLKVTYREPGRPDAPPSIKDIRFEILRNAPAIEAQLAEVGDPSTATTLSTQQEIALQRAEIFAEANLWMDVLRETMPIQNDGAWGTTIKAEINEMCDPHH